VKQLGCQHKKSQTREKISASKQADWLLSKYDVIAHEITNVKGLAVQDWLNPCWTLGGQVFCVDTDKQSRKCWFVAFQSQRYNTHQDCSKCWREVLKKLHIR
jgi:putative transposase